MIADLASVDVKQTPELNSWAIFEASRRNETAVIEFIEGFPDA